MQDLIFSMWQIDAALDFSTHQYIIRRSKYYIPLLIALYNIHRVVIYYGCCLSLSFYDLNFNYS